MVLREEHFSALRINWRNKAENLRRDRGRAQHRPRRARLPRRQPGRARAGPAAPARGAHGRDAQGRLAVPRDAGGPDRLRAAGGDPRGRAAGEPVPGEPASGRRWSSRAARWTSICARSRSAPRSAGPRRTTWPGSCRCSTRRTSSTRRPGATRRRTSSASSPPPTHQVYVLDVADRFGDHGLVGTAVVREEGDAWVIDNVLLSCRAMGLSVETALLHADLRRRRGARASPRLVGEFIPTPKNGPCADFYRRHGFRPDGDAGGAQRWVLDPRADRIENPAWIAVKTDGSDGVSTRRGGRRPRVRRSSPTAWTRARRRRASRAGTPWGT